LEEHTESTTQSIAPSSQGVKYPFLSAELERWWNSRKNPYATRVELAEAAGIPAADLNRYFAGARFPYPSMSERLFKITKLDILGPGRMAALFRERHSRVLRFVWTKDLLGLAQHYVSLQSGIGKVSRLRYYSFSFRILSAAERQRLKSASELTPRVLVSLDLGYDGQRRFAALLFFSRVLAFTHAWKAAQGREFNQLLNRFPVGMRTKWQGTRRKGSRSADGHLKLFRYQPANLPFERPRCPECQQSLAIYSRASHGGSTRGKYWYFGCVKCHRRYWSNDGRAVPVNPRGNWKNFEDRTRCPECNVECRTAAGPSKRNKSRYWQCPKCGRRYRNAEGRAVPTQPGGRAVVKLSFLPDRECPSCGAPHLRIQARPNPPVVRAYYFRCSNCDSSFRWNEDLRRLVRLRRKRFGARRKGPGRPGGLTTVTKERIRFVAAIKKLGKSLRGNSKKLFPETPQSAESNAYRFASQHRPSIEDLTAKLTSAEAEKMFREGPESIGKTLGRR
jgi:uncharacterized protein with PIN domain